MGVAAFPTKSEEQRAPVTHAHSHVEQGILSRMNVDKGMSTEAMLKSASSGTAGHINARSTRDTGIEFGLKVQFLYSKKH